jgi:thioredoxin 1
MLAPVMEEIATEHPEIKVCKVNVDEEQALAMDYQVMSIPTVIAFQNGEVAAKTVGYQPKEGILNLLK